MKSHLTLFTVIVCLALLAASCSPAATPISQKPSQPPVQPEVELPAQTVDPYEQKPGSNDQSLLATQTQPQTVTEAPAAAEGAEAQLDSSWAEPDSPQAFGNPYPTTQPGYYPDQPVPYPGSSAPVDNYFQDYGVNPYEDPREDHLSTFALDVDTASYSVARRYVEDGMLPPAEAVRVEEFVNYFEQGYASPQDTAFALYADGAPSPFDPDGTLWLRFGVQGYQVPEPERLPAQLTFVIDVSGSMDMENRLGLVKQSLKLLVDRLRPTDSVAIVVYGTEARVVLNPTSGENRDQILAAIFSLATDGSTNAEAGLRLGYQLAYEALRPGVTNRVILCSDGVANVGETGPEGILESIRGYADQGITLTSVGFGMGNFNDVLMEQLADQGDGMYAYVDDLDEAQRLFVDDLTATLQTIAMNAKVQVDFNPEVVARYRLVGYENRAVADQDFRNDTVDAGEIGAGHTATAVYAVQLRPGASGRVSTVQLRWEDPQTHVVQEINGNFNTWDITPGFAETAPRYQLSVLAAQYAELLRGSPWARSVNLDDLARYSQRLVDVIPGDPAVMEFANLVEQARWIGLGRGY